MKFFSSKNRPLHLGGYPLEQLHRLDSLRTPFPDIPFADLRFERPEMPQSIANAMAPYQAMMDVLRAGKPNPVRAEIPEDATERAAHIKAFGYYNDATMMGICTLPDAARLAKPRQSAGTDALAEDLRNRQTKTLAAGVDVIMANLREAANTPVPPLPDHSHAVVILFAYGRDPRPDEPGTDWIMDVQAERAALRATENATVLADYIRQLGFDARVHSATTSDVNLGTCALACGLAVWEGGALSNPWLGTRFGLAVVTTDMALTPDRPLAPLAEQPNGILNGLPWKLGTHGGLRAGTSDPYAKRNYVDGAHPFETLKRVSDPTTYIDAPNVPRVPKRSDLFARGQFGDMGPKVQDAMKGGHHVVKTAPAAAQRRLLGALILLQDGAVSPEKSGNDPARNATNLKAASYFLGSDAAGLSACPDWTWYSHDATGTPITPPHDQALSLIVDQGFETTDGSSGDDWISVSQSMRAYLRFSIIGGIIAQHMRNLGFASKSHTVMDGDVLQPPLLLLSGLGEVSRIGEVILNPFLGPRLKSGVVTTTMPVAHDLPVDFGLQKFCESCNKCARECPSGAITAGPKKMFNGYEIWKSDSQKCATYRITNQGGGMCGRCMKTCPWNLEGLFAEAPFRWAAMHIPKAAPALAKLDDVLGNGGLNPVKKWWWDIEVKPNGGFAAPAAPVNARDLQRDLDLKFEDQTLAVYPAPLAPHPWPYPDPMNREAGIKAHAALLTADEHRAKNAAGATDHLHLYTGSGDAPVLDLRVSGIEKLSDGVTLYTFTDPQGGALPEWTAGGHIDLVVAPEFLRPYSLLGDPADRSRYQIAVLREDKGRGGSALLHRVFTANRRVFVSKPVNHFELLEEAPHSLLMGGGIGITPMMAFAHRLHALGKPFDLHYSASTRASAAFCDILTGMPWADHVHLHLSDEGSRADLLAIMSALPKGSHVYTCGPDTYMQSVMDSAIASNIPDAQRHLEYFSTPDLPEYVNHPFTLRLKSGRDIDVSADQSAADALIAAGLPVDLKCSDGICGVCKCGVIKGAVEHRDFVLSAAQREDTMILCQSRAATPNTILEIDL
ncbi:4Fe-4S dicluster domain-containing protein [Sulfitobacter sp. M57]|uniref:4Fe-4S double cluster binding domain-containing protein n=1 Tax=unclassified Sulfitobacter TaxID=196795 RepID=UPI0023E1B0E2|nr:MULTISPECIES: 4Fe-4S double cluster binding domain-containing protein [unclassified Sulfitobacter]MDF3415922.1 4Fe-4S dicluster domain-containing protein [Sulfitobacter sp. KE5]MDF3423402.1 4Fe-4S dicluster domain-containing protein [Sulfitobacter sp. KE43]MDF3434468.1 4Fe-4S dicluster domain-containing protein [Sulfitobacter sp. KE42]MDF3460108.1 4Fe-4S dicluster domain-containing protein [Sulfitobacter sp. S74]MDF3464006.1 4Fe-4S dicluster domain-containing protein [Sulfitobacter sp. Ks18